MDYGTDAAIFFSYWTFLPFISASYCGLLAIEGIVGICAVTLDDQITLKVFLELWKNR